jgi:light-regulated signal transduction histidine kinase (bacteriophytochrome)
VQYRGHRGTAWASIVKQLVESHGGKIEIETAAGLGTTFIVSRRAPAD